jgi:hypothetical protein
MASKEGFAVACIELLSLLWAELDSLSVAVEPMHPQSAALASSPQAQILRLELILLLDACGCARWRTLLAPSQRRFLQSLLGDVPDTLSA